MSRNTPTNTVIEQITVLGNKFYSIQAEVGKIIVGQKHAVEAMLNAVLSHGHILLEGVPGVAKTTMIKSVAKTLGLSFNRIQFTPDLLPADVTGTMIYNPKTQEFDTKKGPVFANFILADEINRAPAKVQSALLEAMQEHQVTIGSHTYILDEPFLVLATQNPIEQEGTYRLPEAQLDRFLFKVTIDYSTISEEKEIVLRSESAAELFQVVSHEEIMQAQKLVQHIYVDDKIVDYIIDIVFATREPKKYGLDKLTSYLVYGVSPRGSLALHVAAKSRAFLRGRYYVTPDDVKLVALQVLRHRLIRSYEAEADSVSVDSLIEMILKAVKSP
jgi:MoxR-like ATPase